MDYRIVRKLNDHSHSGFLYLVEYIKNNKIKSYAAKKLGDGNEVNILKYLGKSDYIIEYCGKCDLEDKDTNNIEKYFFTRFSNNYIPLNFFKLNKNWDNFYLIIKNIINGIEFIHNKGVAHRDVKPGNILINPKTFNIKYIDFEQSSTIDMDYPKSQKYCGTRQYASPFMYKIVISENYLSFKDLKKSDYFSIGIIIYEFILNITPFGIYKNKNIKRIEKEINIEHEINNEQEINNEIKKKYFNSYNYNLYKNKDVELKYKNIENYLTK